MAANFTESDEKGQIMPLTNEQKKQYKSIGHDLKPVLTVAGNGLSEGVLAELDRALVDHELIKVQIKLEDRDDRRAVIEELCKHGRAELVQTIGKMALIYRKNPQPNKQLSNIHRYK
jgi:RNA-binding protein